MRALVEHVRTAVLAGICGPSLAKTVRSTARRAFKQLERGLAGYAVKR
jgi:hypothetical protein